MSTGDQASSGSDSSKEAVANSDMDTASRDCITCLDTEKITIQTAQKNYQKRVQASSRLSKGRLWTEAQLKRIGDSHLAMWGNNHDSIQTEWDLALAEDHNFFDMCRMVVRTDQLLCIAAATDSQIYTWDLGGQTHGQVKTLVLLLKQYHTHYYCFYEKGMTRPMVGLKGLHTSSAFRHSNVSSSVGLKLFCPWCFKLGGNTEMIATHLREVHYWLAITCDLCKSFMHWMSACLHRASWRTAQAVKLSMWRMHRRRVKEAQGTRARQSFLKLVQVALMNPAGQKDAQHFPSNSADEQGLIHPLDLPESFWPSILSRFSLNHTNCHVFVSTNIFMVPWCFG